MTEDLHYRPMRLEAADLSLFRECFERNGSPRSREHLEWQYRDNPTGKVFVDLACRNASGIASIYASLPVFARVDGVKRLALQSLDTLTDAEYRGKGLFVRLARSLFDRATTQKVAFIYGFPNGNSAHGFFKRLEWKSLDPVPFLVRPLRIPYVVDRLQLVERLGMPRLRSFVPNLPLQLAPAPTPPGFKTIELNEFDERVEDLWRDFSLEVGAAVERDAPYLEWRLVRKPGQHYRHRALVRNGRIDALVSWCVKGKHGGTVGYVMELMHRRRKTWMGWLLLQRALWEMAREGADVALAWCFDHSPNHRAYRLSGFIPFPERFRPIELHVGARAFDQTLNATVTNRQQWYMSYLDSDTV
jgi:GNAT superfamily N-acetyltransferase